MSPQLYCVVDGSAGDCQVGSPRRRLSVNTASALSFDTSQQLDLQTWPLYDINVAGVEDKFTTARYNANKQSVKWQEHNNCALFEK